MYQKERLRELIGVIGGLDPEFKKMIFENIPNLDEGTAKRIGDELQGASSSIRKILGKIINEG
ncbi:MAG: hypothetical protein Q8R55_06925 [Candidatus Taylorbacteria bacterium]|nr:hypothetical protein [Candidatus Taylorbacteria bacterium]